MWVWNFPRRWKKIMPLSLLHKRRRKWMGCREKSGASPADGHSRNAGTPPPRAGRAAAQGTARPEGRAPQASRPTGLGGPLCRPCKNAETCPMNAVGAGPRPARGLLPGVRAFKRSPSSGPLGPLPLLSLRDISPYQGESSFPLEEGRLTGGQRPPLTRGRNLLGRAGEDTRPYKIWGIFRFFRKGRRPRRPAGAQCAPLQRKRGTP